MPFGLPKRASVCPPLGSGARLRSAELCNSDRVAELIDEGHHVLVRDDDERIHLLVPTCLLPNDDRVRAIAINGCGGLLCEDDGVVIDPIEIGIIGPNGVARVTVGISRLGARAEPAGSVFFSRLF